MPGEPVLTKLQVDERCDYKPMTWERFLLLRAWAKWIAWHEQCTVAMVGSVLEKTVPRDIDIALIWPAARYEEMFGPLPTEPEGHKRLWESWSYQSKRVALYVAAQNLIKFATRIDIRLCPDTWWPEKDRLILGTPTEDEPPNTWDGIEFYVGKVTRAGDGKEEDITP